MEEILPRLYRIVVPLPGNPLKEINSYVLTSDDRNLVIDTGMNRPECKKVLEPGLAELGVDLSKTDFMITHLHADHQGMVSGLIRKGSRAYMGEDDAYRLKAGKTAHARRSPMGDYAAKSGFPDDELKSAMVNHPGLKYGPESVVGYQYMAIPVMPECAAEPVGKVQIENSANFRVLKFQQVASHRKSQPPLF